MDETQTPDQGGDELNLDNLDDLDVDQLKELAKAKALEAQRVAKEFTEYRANSEKWVKKVLDEKKGLEAKASIDVEAIVQQKIVQDRIQSKLEQIDQQLPDDLRKKFREEFNDITEGKVLTTENISKYIEKAVKLLDLWKESIPAMWSSFAPSKPATEQKRSEERSKAVHDILKEHGI